MYSRNLYPSSISQSKHPVVNQIPSRNLSQLTNSNVTDTISSVFSSPSIDIPVQYNLQKPNEMNHISNHSPASEEIFGRCSDSKPENRVMGSEQIRIDSNNKKMSSFDIEYALLEGALKKENRMELNNYTVSSITSDFWLYTPLEQSYLIEQMLLEQSGLSMDNKMKKEEERFGGSMDTMNFDLQPQLHKFEEKRHHAKPTCEQITSKETSEREAMDECDVSFSNDRKNINFQDVMTTISRDWEHYNKDCCFTTTSSDYKQGDDIDVNIESKATGKIHDQFAKKGYTGETTEDIVSSEKMEKNRIFGVSRQSPTSDMSVNNCTNETGIGSHPDLYENLPERIREKVDELKRTINSMPRRKLRESLAQGLTIEDVEPLMILNRDELAGMLGLGVTTWKTFVHHTLGIPRWPARALKSQQVKERKLLEKKIEAESRGDYEYAQKAERDLTKLIKVHQRRREMFRNDAKLRVASVCMKQKSR